MKVKLRNEDPSRLVIITKEEKLSSTLDYMAGVSKEVGDLFEQLALKSLNKNIKKFPVDDLKEVFSKMCTMKNQDIEINIPHKILELVSSSSRASTFFKDLEEKALYQKSLLEEKKRVFEMFSEHLKNNNLQ